ncbi:MAG: MiaB/RimO family radical SAM methylthiotransferase [Candidatus Gracilibacteria bacterium]|nr:MiaB/RimO family radical SAM methylthiotransferase [Candidatus Gracilibacteria bacterium]
MKYFIQTFGCQLNYADTEKISMIFLQSGIAKTNSYKEADIVILNTCSVRKKGEDKVLGMIREIHKFNKLNKTKIIVGVTGCMVKKTGVNPAYLHGENEKQKVKQIELLKSPDSIFNSDDILFTRKYSPDFVFRVEEISYVTKILSHILNKNIGNDMKFNEYLELEQLRENPASANIIIQTGCDNFCTFCIVPYTRGREVGRNTEDIVNEAKIAILNGAKEITLLGQNVNSYGKTTKSKLWDKEGLTWNNKNIQTPFRELLNKLDKIEGLDRIRFTSSNPHDMTCDILDAHFELDHTCNYLHFALQSGNDDVLKRMNRKHTVEDFREMVNYLRKKDPLFAISTDIIVGFPDETEEEFEDTCHVFEELEFDFAYIARYSERFGTYASNHLKNNVSDQEKARRWDILNTLLKKNIEKRSKLMIGREEDILITAKSKKHGIAGRTRNFKEVFVDYDEKINIGDMVKVKIAELDRWVLKGKNLS